MTSLDPSLVHLVGSGGAVLFVALLLLVAKPPVTRSTPVAMAPWGIVAACLHLLAVDGAYPALFAPLFSWVLVGPTLFALAGGLWLLLRGFAAARDRNERGEYLTVAGVGAAVSLLAVTAGTLPFARGDAIALVSVPALAAILAGVGYLLLALLDPTAFARARVAGYLVVFSQTLDGVAAALRVDVLGQSLARPSVEAALAVTDALGVTGTLGAGWLLIIPRLLLTLAVVAFLTRGTDRTEPARVLALAGLVLVGVAAGLVTLLGSVG